LGQANYCLVSTNGLADAGQRNESRGGAADQPPLETLRKAGLGTLQQPATSRLGDECGTLYRSRGADVGSRASPALVLRHLSVDQRQIASAQRTRARGSGRDRRLDGDRGRF